MTTSGMHDNCLTRLQSRFERLAYLSAFQIAAGRRGTGWSSERRWALMTERRFHLGIDYGTSTSKLVLRDYGAPEGDRAFILLISNGFRIPSGVTFANDHFNLSLTVPDRTDQTRFESVKMRVAEEAIMNTQRFHYGPKPSFPNGISARDLSVLTVWWLISFGHCAALNRLANTGGGDLVMGMTMGIPMSFYENVRIRDCFLQIARTTWRLYRHEGTLPDLAAIEFGK